MNFNVKMVAFSSVIFHCCERIFIDVRLKATIENSRQRAFFQFANIMRSILIAIDRRHFDSEYLNLFVRLSLARLTFNHIRPRRGCQSSIFIFNREKAKYGSRLKEKVTFNYEDFPLSTGTISFTSIDLIRSNMTSDTLSNN